MPMRSELVDNYFSTVMNENGQTEVFKELYRNVMDNRIFNCLKQQLNELISDDKSLIQADDFKKMFFTFFKGEAKANYIYERLLPFITVWYIGDKVYNDPSEMTHPDQLLEADKMVSIQKLSKFIDGFNFSAI